MSYQTSKNILGQNKRNVTCIDKISLQTNFFGQFQPIKIWLTNNTKKMDYKNAMTTTKITTLPQLVLMWRCEW